MRWDIFTFICLVAGILAAGLTARFTSGSVVERFAANRQLSWLSLGFSMAAAQLSADTPLLVAGAVYSDGIAGNWFWWISAPGVLATLFFFAPLWRRSGVLTDVEILSLRYGDSPYARFFRIYRAIIDGILLNSLVLASNLFAFTLLLDSLFQHKVGPLGLSYANFVSAGFLVVTGAFVILAGFRGLVRANTIEFALAVLAAGLLAGYAVSGLPHGMSSLTELASASQHGVFTLVPNGDFLNLILLFGLGWWHNASGNTMLVQRMVASRDESEARLTVMTYSVLHYILRPWGWYLVGAAALYYWPHLKQAESAFPFMAKALFPNWLFGLLAATVALSFVGSVSSRLNFGASYLVNDVAKLAFGAISQKQARMIEILATVFLAALAYAIAASHLLPSIRGVYQLIIMMMAGTGFVSIARWYWSGTTLQGEIAANISALVVAGLTLSMTDIQKPGDFALMSALNFLVGMATSIFVSRVWPNPDAAICQRFYDQVRPGGPGWNRYHGNAPHGLQIPASKWVLANVALFSAIFSVVSLLANKLFLAGIEAFVALISGGILVALLARRRNLD